jgi:hypothetical protein
MKKAFIVLMSMLTTMLIFAQAPPQKVNYQSVARNNAGQPLINTTVNLTFEILQGSSTGSVAFTESQTKTTNDFGLFTAEIGAVNTSDFPSIAWGSNTYFLRITVNGDVMPATQLLSVPYALHAGTASTGTPGVDGINCWDSNGNGINDPSEDTNGDTFFNGLDCKGDSGQAGINGTNGVSINWQNSQPTTPILNDAYYNSGLGQSLIWDGTAWQQMTQDGSSATFVAGPGISIVGNTISATDTSVTNEIQILSTNAANDSIFLSNGGSSVPLPSSSNLWNNNALGIDYSSGNVGIGDNAPNYKLSVNSPDSLIASFAGNNPDFSAISITNIDPSGTSGVILLAGSDTALFGLNPVDKLLVIDNSTTGGHIALNADSTIALYGINVANSASNMIYNRTSRIYNEADTIYNYSSGGTIVNANQGMFLTDSLYVLGNNSANPNWVLANDGAGQAKWSDPLNLGIGGGLFIQGTGNDIYNNTDSVGIGVVDPKAPLHVVGTGFGAPIALFEKGGFLAATIDINHTGSNTSGINFKNGGVTTSNISSSTSNLLSLVSDNVVVGTGTATGKFQVNSSSSVTSPTLQLHETSTGFSRIKHTNTVAGKYWITEAGINATDAFSGYSIGYENGSGTVLPFVVYGDSKVGVNNLAAPLASFHVMDDNAASSGIASEGFSQPGKIIIARNNFSSPNRGAIAANDQIGNLSFSGYGTSTYGNGPQILANATEAFSNTANGSEMIFRTVNNGTTNDVDRLRITNDGNIDLALSGGTVNISNQYNLPNTVGSAGDVMTMNGGNATWQPLPAATASPWSKTGVNIHQTVLTDNVGIGVSSSLAAKLDVAGNAKLASGQLYLGPVGGVNNGYTGVYEDGGDLKLAVFQPANTTNFGTNSYDALTVKSNTGLIGIGTTAPATTLHLDGTLRLNNIGGVATLSGGEVLTADASGNATWQAPSGAASPWTIGSGIIYNTTDNVGIGTTNPIFKLDVDPVATYAGPIARVRNLNASNVNDALQVVTNGSGAGLSLTQVGTGHGQSISLNNTTSTNSALQITTDGAGNGIDITHSGAASGTRNGVRSVASGVGATYNNGGYFSASGALSTNAGIRAFGVASNGAGAYGIYANAQGTSTSNTYGVYGQNTSSSTAIAYAGYFQNINSTGSSIHGVRSDVTSSAAGDQFGLSTYMSTASAGTKYGVYSAVDGGTTNWAGYFAAGNVYIADNLVIPTNAGANKVLTSDAAGTATWQTPSLSGDGIYTGSGTLSGATTVTQGANALTFNSTAANGFNIDNNVVNNTAFRVENLTDGTPGTPGGSVGAQILVSATSTERTAVYAAVTGTGTGNQLGIWSAAEGAGSGFNRGINSTARNSTGSNIAGDFTASGDFGDNYGLRVNIGGAHSATKYGLRIITSGTALGTKYGVFTQNEDYNYFSGNVGVGTSTPTEKLEIQNGNLRISTGHIRTSGTTPTGFGSTIVGNDIAGMVTMGVGIGPGQVNFNIPYTSIPTIIITPGNAESGASEYYVANVTTSGFEIYAPTGGGTGIFYYQVIEFDN